MGQVCNFHHYIDILRFTPFVTAVTPPSKREAFYVPLLEGDVTAVTGGVCLYEC